MFSSESVQQVQTVLLLLLLFVAGFAIVAQWLKVAYPIVLIVAGLLVSLLPHAPRIPLDPELVFLVLLPPLLYASASAASWRELRHNGLNIGMLAFGLVAFTVWGVAEFCDRFIVALDWKAGFVLGAVVAATDAIAATSIARSIGLPRRIVDILEGESLLNDATALLALEFGLRLLNRGDTPGVGEAVLRLLWLTGAGAVIGLAVGWVFAKGHALIEDGPVEIVLSLVVPYAAYLAGEGANASGVIAVVACGLYMGRKSATIYSARVRMQVRGVWEAMEFILNGLVFVLIGLQLPLVLALVRGTYGWATLIRYGLIFSAVLIVLRLVWTFPAAWFSHLVRKKLLRRGETRGMPWRPVFVVGWTGMRGVIALAASISLPQTIAGGKPFAVRSLIIFLAFSVILVTLVLQGLTLPPLIRWLGLAKVKGIDEEEREARRIVLRSAIEYLEGDRQAGDEEMEHVYDDLLHRYRHRLAAVGGGVDDEHFRALDRSTYARLRAVATGAIQAERRTLIGLRDKERIGDEALRTLEHELDLQESRYQLGPE